MHQYPLTTEFIHCITAIDYEIKPIIVMVFQESNKKNNYVYTDGNYPILRIDINIVLISKKHRLKYTHTCKLQSDRLNEWIEKMYKI